MSGAVDIGTELDKEGGLRAGIVSFNDDHNEAESEDDDRKDNDGNNKDFITGDTVVDNDGGSVNEGNIDKGGDANDDDDDMISVAT